MSDDETALIQRAAYLRDSDAYGVLVGRYQARVVGYLRRLARDRVWADDLAQDTFVHAWNKLRSFKGDGSFEGWLLRVAYTIFLQAYRQRKNRREDSLETSSPERADAPGTDAQLDLDRLLAKLEPDIRTMLLLIHAYGYTYAEVGRVVDLPAGTVKSHVSRAKARLRQQLNAERIDS